MATELMLEIEDTLDKSIIVNSLVYAGASEFSEESTGFDCFFDETKISAYVYEKSKPYWTESGTRDEVVAEDLDFVFSWKVGFRVIFRYPRNAHTESNAQINSVLRFLEKNSMVNFVLSFQYEKIIAVRNASGLNFLSSFE